MIKKTKTTKKAKEEIVITHETKSASKQIAEAVIEAAALEIKTQVKPQVKEIKESTKPQVKEIKESIKPSIQEIKKSLQAPIEEQMDIEHLLKLNRIEEKAKIKEELIQNDKIVRAAKMLCETELRVKQIKAETAKAKATMDRRQKRQEARAEQLSKKAKEIKQTTQHIDRLEKYCFSIETLNLQTIDILLKVEQYIRKVTKIIFIFIVFTTVVFSIIPYYCK